LVLLRRVLRVLHAAVRPPAAPLGILAHVRMIRRALESDVERDLEALPSRVLDERTEILERAERGMHALVPARRGTDLPRRARLTRARIEPVVRALAMRHADRVNRRQIHDVEAEPRDVR